jgi:hypothetical protein
LNYLGLPSSGNTGTSLNFGDEYYFYGNLETDIQATIYNVTFAFDGRTRLESVEQYFRATFSGTVINQDIFKATFTSITFPWLPNAEPVQPWMNTPNDADLYSGNFSFPSCYVTNPNPVFNTNCPGIRDFLIDFPREISSFDDPIVINSINAFSRSNVVGNDDPSYNHPFCTDPIYGTQLNTSFNSMMADKISSTPQGSRFLCQISRFFMSRGAGAILPMQLLYSTSLTGIDFDTPDLPSAPGGGAV